jgi:hypothetical protein
VCKEFEKQAAYNKSNRITIWRGTSNSLKGSKNHFHEILMPTFQFLADQQPKTNSIIQFPFSNVFSIYIIKHHNKKNYQGRVSEIGEPNLFLEHIFEKKLLY